MATAEKIINFEDLNPQEKVVAAPTPKLGSGLPLNNPFYLIIVLLSQDLNVQKESLFATAAQQQVLQNQYNAQLTDWTKDTQSLTDGITNGKHSYQINGGGIAQMAIGSTLIAVGAYLMVTSACAAVFAPIMFVIGLALVLAGIALLVSAAVCGYSNKDNTYTTDSGMDLNESYGLDHDGNSITMTALQQILPQDQATLQQTQNELSKLVQTQIGPTQDMQQQDGQMIQNALRLMQALVAQLPV